MKTKVYKSILILFILLSIGLFFRTLNISKEFSGDETSVIQISELDLKNGISLLKKTDVYPPLTYIAIHYMMRLGFSGAGLRLYFVVFGLGCSILVYLLAKEYLDIKLAWIALLLSVFSPLLIFGSQYARSYIDSAFWMLASTFFMLKIIKRKESLINWTGYTISSVLAIYTSYFSVLLMFAQCAYVVIFRHKNKKFILKWLIAICMIGLLFLPWIPQALAQYNNIIVNDYDWSSKGFNMGPFRVGLFARNVLSIVGFDPYFMVFQGGISKHFSKLFLTTGLLIGSSTFMFILIYSLEFLKKRFKEKTELIWFFPIMTFFPLAIFWSAAILLNILPNSRYLMAFHAFFIILLACFIYKILERKILLGNFVLGLCILIFILRIPSAVSTEYDLKGASQFLEKNLAPYDCIVYTRSAPQKINTPNIVNVGKYFRLNNAKSEYIFKSDYASEKLKREINSFKRVWFYRVYGNVDVFGGNDLLDQWMKEENYKKIMEKKFKNINVILYEK